MGHQTWGVTKLVSGFGVKNAPWFPSLPPPRLPPKKKMKVKNGGKNKLTPISQTFVSPPHGVAPVKLGPF